MSNTAYKQTEIGLIPSDWEVRELGEIGAFKNGINKSSEDFGFGYPFVNLMDVFGKSSISQNENFGLINSNDIERKLYDLKKGDVLFIRSSVKPSGVGLTCVIENNLPNIVFSGFIIRYRDNNYLDEGYKRHCFYDESFRSNLIGSSTVSANTNINQEALKKLKIPLPPTKAEQSLIATALSDADALISSLEKLIAKKRNIKQGAMQKLLEPKEGWEVKKLGEVCLNISSGKSITQSQDGSFPIFGSTGVIGWSKTNDYAGNKILVARVGANAGTVNIVDGKYCVSDNTLMISLKPEIDLNFVFSFLILFQLNKLVFGSGQPLITGGQLKNIELPIPKTEEEQTRIATILSDMDAEITALETKLEKYKQVKLGMMQNLLTGKIRLV